MVAFYFTAHYNHIDHYNHLSRHWLQFFLIYSIFAHELGSVQNLREGGTGDLAKPTPKIQRGPPSGPLKIKRGPPLRHLEN